MAKKLLIVVFVLGLCVNGFSQKITSQDAKTTTTIYVTATDINVRETPPSKGLILIGGPGKVAFKLKKNAEVIVLEKRLIESALSKTIWIKIRALDSKKEGWIYWGNDDDKSVNLNLKGVK